MNLKKCLQTFKGTWFCVRQNNDVNISSFSIKLKIKIDLSMCVPRFLFAKKHLIIRFICIILLTLQRII